jgi:hypothetical protein
VSPVHPSPHAVQVTAGTGKDDKHRHKKKRVKRERVVVDEMYYVPMRVVA